MRDSLDIYADSYNFFDIDIISTLGLTDDDIIALKNIEGIEECYGIKTQDTIARIEEKESICKIIEYNEKCNTPAIIEGRLPEKIGECLLDKNYSMTDNISEYIGKNIILENDNLNQKELTIVGIVESPLYISSERGNTTIGNGSINFFIYTKPEVINLDYYTNAYAVVNGAKEEELNSNEYWNLVNPVISKIEKIKENQEQNRYNKLIIEAEGKLKEAQEEFNEEKQKVEKELKTEKFKNEKEFTFTFYEKYFIVSDNKDSYKLRYWHLHKVFETDDFFYLYINKDHAFLIEKSTFSKGNISEFLDFLKKKIWYRF